MKVLAIDKHPYSLSFALFNYEKKGLIEWGTIYYNSKDESERIKEMWENVECLLKETDPNIVLTHWIDMEFTKKKDLVNILTVKTILRKLCIDRKIIYNEFKTNGWEKRITNQKKPSKIAKLKIAKEYSPMIDSVEVANAIILGEGVVHGRLQIGRI